MKGRILAILASLPMAIGSQADIFDFSSLDTALDLKQDVIRQVFVDEFLAEARVPKRERDRAFELRTPGRLQLLGWHYYAFLLQHDLRRRLSTGSGSKQEELMLDNLVFVCQTLDIWNRRADSVMAQTYLLARNVFDFGVWDVRAAMRNEILELLDQVSVKVDEAVETATRTRSERIGEFAMSLAWQTAARVLVALFIHLKPLDQIV